MKLLQSALVLCTLVGSLALAEAPKDKCGCQKPRPTQPTPAQVMKPGQKSAAAAPAPAQKDCPAQPKA